MPETCAKRFSAFPYTEEVATWPYILIGVIIFVLTVGGLVGFLIWQRCVPKQK